MNTKIQKTKSKIAGITLIALVITIIVLLILAGVTINTLIGDNGVLNQATKAKESTDKGGIKEQLDLAVLTSRMGSYSAEIDTSVLNDELDKLKKDEVIDKYTEDTSGSVIPGTAQKGKYKFIIDENGNVTEKDGKSDSSTDEPEDEEFKDKLSDVITKDDYGCYVDYGIDLNEDGKPNDWKIFYKGKEGKPNEGRVFIIAASVAPTKSMKGTNFCPLSDVIESSNGVISRFTKQDLDGPSYGHFSDFCIGTTVWAYVCRDGYFEDESVIGRGHNPVPDAQCSFPDLFEANAFRSAEHWLTDSHNGPAEWGSFPAMLQCVNLWKPFLNSKGEYAIGGPTAEMWINSWNDVASSGGELDYEITNYGYTISKSVNKDFVSEEQWDLYVDLNNGKLGDLDNDGTPERVNGYYVASQSGVYSGLIRVENQGLRTDSYYNGNWYFRSTPSGLPKV